MMTRHCKGSCGGGWVEVVGRKREVRVMGEEEVKKWRTAGELEGSEKRQEVRWGYWKEIGGT